MVQWVSLLKESLAAEYGTRPVVAALATVGPESHPRVRHVICRGIDDEGQVWMASDARSHKNAQLRANPLAELAVYLPTLRRQFRLAGPVLRLVDEHEVRRRHWAELPAATQAMFFWPSPGSARGEDTSAFPMTPPASDPPAEFEPLLLVSLEVDFLDLAPSPHVRRRWIADDTGSIWTAKDLNP